MALKIKIIRPWSPPEPPPPPPPPPVLTPESLNFAPTTQGFKNADHRTAVVQHAFGWFMAAHGLTAESGATCSTNGQYIEFRYGTTTPSKLAFLLDRKTKDLIVYKADGFPRMDAQIGPLASAVASWVLQDKWRREGNGK